MKKTILLLALFCMGLLHAQHLKEVHTVVYFAVNEDNPLPNEYARVLADLKNAKVLSIYGHADTTATTQYNQKLSERRAKNVAAYLKSSGINLAAAVIKGYGELQSLDGGLITDRRVVITYEKAEKEEVAEAEAEKGAPPSLTTQVQAAKKGDKLKLNINFENNSDIVLPSSRPVLNELLKILKANPDLKIEIQGHICCQVNDNTHVSKMRAFMVYSFLVQSGIKKERLSYQSFAGTKPIYPLPEKNEEERIANRRVEIEILEN
jgi:outer membrane protein OmpA-like peptidoglycan-associated protein